MSSQRQVSFPAVEGLTGPAQSVSFDINLAGQNLTQVISQSLIELTFIDKFAGNTLEDTADSLGIEIGEPEGLFRTQFSFATAQPVNVSVTISNWNPPFNSTLTKSFNQMWVKTVGISSRVGEGP